MRELIIPLAPMHNTRTCPYCAHNETALRRQSPMTIVWGKTALYYWMKHVHFKLVQGHRLPDELMRMKVFIIDLLSVRQAKEYCQMIYAGQGTSVISELQRFVGARNMRTILDRKVHRKLAKENDGYPHSYPINEPSA